MVAGACCVDAEGYFSVTVEEMECPHLLEIYAVCTGLDIEVAFAAAKAIPHLVN